MNRRFLVAALAAFWSCCAPLAFAQPAPPDELFQTPTPATPLVESSATFSATPSVTPIAAQPEAARPALHVQTQGPDTAVVGKEAVYTVTLENSGQLTARRVLVEVVIPTGVRVRIGKASSGLATQDSASEQQVLRWEIPQITSYGREQLTLTIVPVTNRAFDLAVSWKLSTASRVQVLEPKLTVSLDGAKDIVFGETLSVFLTVTNPGTGTAENVLVDLSPRISGTQPVQVGDLRPSEARRVELKLPADVVGVRHLQAVARGDVGLKAEAAHTWKVRRAQVQLGMEGPVLEYAGAVVTYHAVLKNQGDAVAKQLTAELALPEGVQYVGGLEGATAKANVVQWPVQNLQPGAERTFAIQCLLTAAGNKQVALRAQGDAAVRTSEPVVTRVEALADLKLNLSMPHPRPVGEATEIELRVTNRGSAAARQVMVVAQCGPEVELVDVSGTATIEEGVVYFQPIARLEPDQAAVLKLKVRGLKSGTHAFHAAVECDDPQSRLASEDTLRFFDRSVAERPVVVQPATPIQLK